MQAKIKKTSTVLVPNNQPSIDDDLDFEWVCNECDFPNFTSVVSEDDIESGLCSCSECGCLEMHKRYFSSTSNMHKIDAENVESNRCPECNGSIIEKWSGVKCDSCDYWECC